ncbi:MAG TPA: dihydroneopterin aldolase [Melioribacteraceae bacterium]|nr:dihydroneopterin aldolase [Melioribacteraceae bacterium]
MQNIIKIKNARFYAYHGVFEEEQNLGGKFDADVDIYTSFANAAIGDDLKKTVNYAEVYKYINNIVHERKYNLIETLATVIADGLLKEYPQIEKIAVRVRKSNVPAGGLIDYVEAEVVKSNGE